MSLAQVDGRLLAEAGRLVREAGLAPLAAEPKPLTGGKNNQVFRLRLDDGRSLVLKSYFHDPRDDRDRLGAEWAFLAYVWARGVRDVPEPLACDRQAHLGLYSFLPGQRLASGAVTERHVEAAVAFLLAVNGPPRRPLDLQPGSEACFSLEGHVATVERRVRRLATLDPAVPLRALAERFVARHLVPAWTAVRARLRERAGATYDDELPTAELVVSPSDFGFHNALVSDSGVAFVDFEYAGRDDPAKLICDFVCQPEVPIPPALCAATAERIVCGLGLPARHGERWRLLIDLYRVKWVCIILNHFLPLGAARRAFAGSALAGQQAAAQLALAEAKLAACGT